MFFISICKIAYVVRFDIFFKNLVWELIFILLFVSIANAFQTNALQVTVTDQNSAFITNFTIRLKNGNQVIKEYKNADSQTVVFPSLELGKYILEIESAGFKTHAQDIEIKQGKNQLSIKLEVKEFVENVDINSDPQETSVENAFSNFLTKEQIEALPDHPEDIEKTLKRQFGNDTVILVDGGPGGVPPKSLIAAIRVSRSSFDAEYHQLGNTYINIITKAGSAKWSGTTFFNFNDSSFNARDPFAQKRLPSQIKRFDSFLFGPIIKNKTSAQISVGGSFISKQETVIAVVPEGQIQDTVENSNNSIGSRIKLSHNLDKNKTLNVTYNISVKNSKNDGVGGFNLPERAFNSKNISNKLGISESGYFGKRFFNEIRFQYSDDISETSPVSKNPAINVIDAFSGGGAGNRYKSRRKSLWLADNLLFGVGKFHALKIGGLFEYEKRETESAINQNGTFTFSSLDDYILGRPSMFTQSLESRKVSLSQIQFGAFIQDDVRVHKSLMLNLGLRYEWQSNIADNNNFSPRLGLTWSPFKNGKISFRGGAGIYYNWLDTNSLATVLSQDITQPGEIIIINPNFSDTLNSGAYQTLGQSYRKLADDLKNPYNFLASFGVETRITTSNFLRVLYKFEKGLHQLRSRDINAPKTNSVARPNPNYGRIAQVESSANFDRKSLNINLNGSVNKNVSYGFDYTFSKTNSDNIGIFGLPSDNNNLRADYSIADSDQPHLIYSSIMWQIRKGLNVSAMFNATSGLPYTITTGFDNNLDTVFNDRPAGILRNSERGTWQKQVDISLGWTIGIGKKSAGPTTTVIMEGEPTGDVDIARSSKFTIKAMATVSNVFNQTNFNNFVGVQTSPFYLQPTSANNPRRIVLGLRFSF